MDSDRNVYVLDIDRFRTDRISECFDHIRDMHVKWDFRKLRAEMSVGQSMITRELKEMYIKPMGLALSVDEFFPTRNDGSKDERIAAVLQHRYDNKSMWHYRGGNCQILEEELMQKHPPHDDVKDALAAAVDICVPPLHMGRNMRTNREANVIYSPRFGGVSYRG